MKYRPEIDGLRAVAVIPVILFHAGFGHFRGGFVGVDVFFVISGFLITTIILSEKEQGTFSLVTFYERRARRILPALFLVMFVSLPFAWFWFMPADMKYFSQSLLAVSTFASNILFWRNTGYWDAVNELIPLLHTWSLAVEEQYYVLFPLFLMVMWRFRKRWILSSFMMIALISFAGAQWAAYHKPTANFFLLPTRGWELAIGASVAFLFLYRKQALQALQSHKFVAEVSSLLGLLMIGYAVFSFDEKVPFPSVYALTPTAGAGLIILFSSPRTVVGRLLGTKLLVGTGLISYSAYLWHQPLLAFTRYRNLKEPGELLLFALVVLSFLLAYLSWRFVEKPFRNKAVIGRKAVFSCALIGSLVFILIGLSGIISNGFEGRTAQNGLTLKSIADKQAVNYGLSKTCEESFTLSPDCRTSDEPEILIWGDSFAMHLVQGIIASSPDAGIIQMTKSSCGAFFDVAPVVLPKFPMSWAAGCLEFSGKVREWLKANTSVKYVVLSTNIGKYLAPDNALLLRGGDLVAANADVALREFERTLGELKSMGLTPVVFSPLPANGVDVGRCLALAESLGFSFDTCDFLRDEIPQNNQDVYRFLEKIAKSHRVVRLDNLVCDNALCKTHDGSTFLYRDGIHLSREGSAELGRKGGFYSMVVEGGGSVELRK